MTQFDLAAALRGEAAAYRHIHNEHLREGVEGTWRRHDEARLEEISARFETLLRRWVRDEELRARWREHLLSREDEPPAPVLREPVLFKALLDAGSLVEVRRAGGELAMFVDGALSRRLPEEGVDGAIEGIRFHEATEVFDASSPALAALKTYADQEMATPPWEWAIELYEDGLIDESFALTSRGRRFLIEGRAASAALTL